MRLLPGAGTLGGRCLIIGWRRLSRHFCGLASYCFGACTSGATISFPGSLIRLPQKQAWLNVPFLFARDGIAIVVMALISSWFISASRRPDAVEWANTVTDIEMPPPAIRRIAPAIAILYCVVYSLLAFDLIMSLSPQWHSTLIRMVVVRDLFLERYRRDVVLRGAIPPLAAACATSSTTRTVLHDYGKMVFAFSVFWIYLSFAQYMVIWYGDIPTRDLFPGGPPLALPVGVQSHGWRRFLSGLFPSPC